MDAHETNKSKVCILCLKKSKVLTSISEKVRAIICERYYSDVITRASVYPTKICTNCRLRCTRNRDGFKVDSTFPHKYNLGNYVEFEPGLTCKCEICEAANLNSGAKQAINLPHVSVKVDLGRPKTLDKPAGRAMLVCNLCLTEIGQGKPHWCNATSRCGNLTAFMNDENSPPKTAEAAVSMFLREKQATTDSGTIRLSNQRRKPSYFEKLGSNRRSPISNPQVSCKDLFAVKTDNNLSMSRTLGVMKGLKKSGVKFEPYTSQKLTQMNSKLSDLFKVVKLGELTEDLQSQHADLPVVYCTNVQLLIERIRHERSTGEEDQLIKLGIDGGGGSLKITLTVMPMDPAQHCSLTEKFKQGGVKRLLILALVPDLPEKYHYVEVLWRKLLKLNNLDAVVACDLKIANIMIGIMAHSSSKPCPYCDATKKNLATERGNLRTIANIRQNLAKPVGDRQCCVNDPLIPGNPEKPIFLSVPPPPLHIKLGIVNTVFKAVEKVFPDWCDLWVNKSNVRHQQRTYGFTGGACQKLVENASILMDNPDLVGYAKVLINFKEVEEKCLKMNLDPHYQAAIDAFAESWIQQSLPGTSKFHILRFHVPQFCQETGHSLGMYNEQACESVHYDYNDTWDRYKTTKTSKVYQERVLSAVVDYNSGHI